MSYSDEIVLSFFEEIEENFGWLDWHDHIHFISKEMEESRNDLKQQKAFKAQTYADSKGNNFEKWTLIWKGQNNLIAGCPRAYRKSVHEDSENFEKLCKITENLLNMPSNSPEINNIESILLEFYTLADIHLDAMFCRALVPIFQGKFTTLFNWRCSIVLKYLKLFPESENASWNSDGNFWQKQIYVTEGIDAIFKESIEKQINNWGKNYDREIDYRSLVAPFAWYLFDIIQGQTIFELHKQIIYTGAPGTGKTYLAKRKAKRHINLFLDHFYLVNENIGNYPISLPESDFFFECIQFHPSYGYEDFIEGIRPTGIGGQSNGIDFELTDGSLKAFCRKAGLLEIILLESGISIQTNPTTGEIIETLKQIEEKVSKVDGWDSIFEKYKTRRGDLLEDDSIDFWKKYMIFLNKLKDDDEQKEKMFSSWLPPFFLIIDEVNRSELSRVFGELMYCFEYRGSGGSIKTQYATLMDKQKEYALAWHPERGSVFFLPHNLYILGTMNNIDRSVETFDLALRRRFYWDDKKYNGDILRMILQKESKGVKADNNEEQDVNKPKLSSDVIDRLIKKAKSLNEAIEKHDQLGTDYQIGHAYFTRILKYASEDSSAKQYKALWEHHLEPLLKEYVRGIPQSNEILKGLKTSYEV